MDFTVGITPQGTPTGNVAAIFRLRTRLIYARTSLGTIPLIPIQEFMTPQGAKLAFTAFKCADLKVIALRTSIVFITLSHDGKATETGILDVNDLPPAKSVPLDGYMSLDDIVSYADEVIKSQYCHGIFSSYDESCEIIVRQVCAAGLADLPSLHTALTETLGSLNDLEEKRALCLLPSGTKEQARNMETWENECQKALVSFLVTCLAYTR